MQPGALVSVIKVWIIGIVIHKTVEVAFQIILNSCAAHESQENASKLIKFESSFVWAASPASGH